MGTANAVFRQAPWESGFVGESQSPLENGDIMENPETAFELMDHEEREKLWLAWNAYYDSLSPDDDDGRDHSLEYEPTELTEFDF